jgi:hypothetical protein
LAAGLYKEDGMPRVKGSALKSRINFIKAKDKGGQMEKVLAELPPQYKVEFEKGISANQWYDLDFYPKLNRAIDKVFGNGDLSMIWEIGEFTGDEAFHGVYKALFKLGTPELLLRTSTLVANQYFDGLSIKVLDEKSPTKKLYRLILIGCNADLPEIQKSIGGFVQSIIRISGGKNVKVVLAFDKKDKTSNSEFICSWE